MPSTSVIAVEYEERLLPFCPILNKLIRYFGSSAFNTLVTAATSTSDLITRVYAALVSGTIELYGPEVRLLAERLEQQIRLMEKLGLINDTIAGSLTTVNSASASTDLGYLVAGIITLNGYDRTGEEWAGFDTNTSFTVTA